MSTPLFFAVAICLGSPQETLQIDGRTYMTGDYCGVAQEWIDAGPDIYHMDGYALGVCKKKLDAMVQTGNYVKMCVPASTDSLDGLGDFRRVWNTDVIWDR